MKKRIHQADQPKGLTHNPFAALRPEGSAKLPSTAPEAGSLDVEALAAGSSQRSQRAGKKRSTSAGPREPSRAPAGGRLLVQREKKGRGGKTVTRVTGLTLEAPARADLARELKRALGCGASVDGPDILLQGAMTERAAEWLRKRLDRDVIIGN